MALEYENTKRIDEEIKKLASMTGLRVLVMFRHDFTDEKVIAKIRSQQTRDNPMDSKFLALILPEYFQSKEPYHILRALLFDPKGCIIAFGTAEGIVGRDGICSFRKIRWRKRQAGIQFLRCDLRSNKSPLILPFKE